jgi:predicted permease
MIASLRRFFSRLVHFLQPTRGEDELAREVASHLDLLEEQFRSRGMSVDEARRAAMLALGGVDQAKERHRDERSFAWLEDARRDSVHALRLLRRNPVMTVTAASSLAIGIGANAAIFSVANALLFRAPVGVTEPERLVDIGISRADGGLNPGSYPIYLDLGRRAGTLDGVYAQEMFPQSLSLEVGGSAASAEAVSGQFVTANFFDVLGVRPAVGRLLSKTDSLSPGGSPILVLSHGYWKRRFNSDPAIAGRALRLNGVSFDVVGVAPEGFQGTGILAADLWLPVTMVAAVKSQSEAVFESRAGRWLLMGGRLKAGVSVTQAAAEIEAIGLNLEREYPSPTGGGLRLLPASSLPGNRGLVAGFFMLLIGLVSLVLLAACANVSGLLLARGASRQPEIALRVALGAARARVVRQLLMETLLLFAAGAAAGLILAGGLTPWLVARLPAMPFPLALSIVLDGRVLAFTIALTLVAALVSGLVPALQACRPDPVAKMKDASQGPAGRSRLRNLFVITQMASSVALLIGAFLFVRALERAGSIDRGFDARGVELASLDLSAAGYSDTAAPLFWRELIDRVRQLNGVEAATLARVVPGGFEGIGLGLWPLGAVNGSSPAPFEPDGNIVEPGYFATLHIPLVAGRDFGPEDRAGTQPVAIVGEAAARHFWPGENPLGKFLAQSVGGPGKPPTTRTLLVVGVARDIKSTSLVDGLSESFLYLPLQQQYVAHLTSTMTIVTRARPDQPVAGAIRALLASLNKNPMIVNSRTLEDSVALGLVPQRVAASAAGCLGIFGLLLAAIGIYGVTAFAVTQRMREFGVRMALGARSTDIVLMVLRQGVRMALVGCVFGLSLAAAASQLLSGFLFGVPSLDPVLFGGAALLASAIGLAACFGPAYRATRTDALIVLRHE